MVIYEWGDYKYLGKITSEEDPSLPVSLTSARVQGASYTPCLAEDIRVYI